MRSKSVCLLIVVLELACALGVAGQSDAGAQFLVAVHGCVHGVARWGDSVLLYERESGLLYGLRDMGPDLVLIGELAPLADDLAVLDGIVYYVPERGNEVERYDLLNEKHLGPIPLPMESLKEYDVVGYCIENDQFILLATERAWSQPLKPTLCHQRLIFLDLHSGALLAVIDGAYEQEVIDLECSGGSLYSLVRGRGDVVRLVVDDASRTWITESVAIVPAPLDPLGQYCGFFPEGTGFFIVSCGVCSLDFVSEIFWCPSFDD